ncbi:MAG: hypothetical protein HYV63_19785 [Candidatus Schekmanbacteria bacterium]|nr:hypothetical protein [Candidatus Schekmanbacteria bacterium]
MTIRLVNATGRRRRGALAVVAAALLMIAAATGAAAGEDADAHARRFEARFSEVFTAVLKAVDAADWKVVYESKEDGKLRVEVKEGGPEEFSWGNRAWIIVDEQDGRTEVRFDTDPEGMEVRWDRNRGAVAKFWEELEDEL